MTLKDAFKAVLKKSLSLTDRQKEFIKYTDAISGMKYSHQPDTKNLVLYLNELEQLRMMQKIVEPEDTTAISYNELIVRAHNRIHAGTGGRTDLIQELYKKWKMQLKEKLTDQQRWENFKE